MMISRPEFSWNINPIKNIINRPKRLRLHTSHDFKTRMWEISPILHDQNIRLHIKNFLSVIRLSCSVFIGSSTGNGNTP